MLLLVVSWIVMTTTHEVGHLLGGWLGGATLVDFDIAPWRLPYSLHRPDPQPLLTLWAGPILGVVIPFCVALVVRHRYCWFVANFCLIANGLYIALAWLTGDRFLDTARLLDAGTSRLSIAVYCAITIGLGYCRFRRDCIAVLSPTGESVSSVEPTSTN